MNNRAIIEGLLYLAGEKGLSTPEIMQILSLGEVEITSQLEKIKQIFFEQNSGLELITTNETHKLVTRKENAIYYQKMAEIEYGDKISRQTLEILAIVAYNQPVTRYKIEEIRGTDSSYGFRILLNRELIHVIGKSEEIGKPNLYGTTSEFLDYLGINNIDELPPISNFKATPDDLESSLFNNNLKDEFEKIKDRLESHKNVLNQVEFVDSDLDYDIEVPEFHHQPPATSQVSDEGVGANEPKHGEN